MVTRLVPSGDDDVIVEGELLTVLLLCANSKMKEFPSMDAYSMADKLACEMGDGGR